MPGNLLGGYEIVREIARSNDIVYEARDPAMNRRVAVKELALPPNLVGQDRRERIERFYREARAAGNLSHPNIVTIFKVGEDSGRHVIAMEALEGDTLRSHLQVGGPLTIQRASDICGQILSALAYAHQRGVVHRDIKPDNIQILPDGVAKLTDFGIARLGGEAGITQAGQVFGTPSYMSPEQITGKPVDQRADIFSMGVVLYEVLTGRKPFTGDTVVTITYNIVNMEPLMPPGVPGYLYDVVRKAMAKDPAQRYSSAGEMAEALRNPPASPLPYPDTRHINSLPRITPLPANAMGATGAIYRPLTPLVPDPVGSAYPASGGQYAPAGRSTPGPPLPPAAVGNGSRPVPALPPTAPPLSSMNDFVVKQAPFLTLIGIVVVFLLIAGVVFWAITTGYQSVTADPAVIRANNKAVDLLDQNNYRAALEELRYVEQHITTDSPLQSKLQHNWGVYWFEAAQDARQHGDLADAYQYYGNALPLYPEKSDEIRQALTIISQNQPPAPGAPASGPAASAATAARPGPFSPGSGANPEASSIPGVREASSPVSNPKADETAQATLADARASYDQAHQVELSDPGKAIQLYGSAIDQAVTVPGGESAPWVHDATDRLNRLDAQNAPGMGTP
jgi:serine/threonine protein kinase